MAAAAAVLATAVVVLALPLAASARIVPGKSIGPVKVGSTMSAVEDRLGVPAEKGCLNRQGVADCDSQMTQWSYPKPKLIVSFVAGVVADVQTTSKKQRTGKGIGPGVKRKKVLNAYKLNCDYAAAGCIVGKRAPKPGRRFTMITFNQRQRVASVTVGKWDLRDTCVFGCG